MAATRAPQPANGPAATKPSREEKKVGKRAKQLAAMDAKAQAEGRYFQEQQAAMQRSGEAQAAQVGLQGAAADAREAALFAKQGSQGIEFGKEWPRVDVSGPGSASAPPLADVRGHHSNPRAAPVGSFTSPSCRVPTV